MVAVLDEMHRSLGEQVVSIGSQMSAAQYELVHVAADFADTDEWKWVGFPSAAHWISEALGVEVSTGREWIRIGRALRGLPTIDSAFASQKLSYSKVRTLSRFAHLHNEIELVELAVSVAAGLLGRELAKWSLRNEDEETVRRRQQNQKGLFASTDGDGSLMAHLRLPAAEGGVLLAAVDSYVSSHRPDASADAPPSLAQQRADALVALITNGGASVNVEVVLHVRGDGCSFDDGTPLSQSDVCDMLPGSFVRAMIHNAAGLPINSSFRQRYPTDRQKRLVKERDRSCVDCGSSAFLEYDHVPEFELTNQTVVEELQLRCSRCHRIRHTWNV